MTQYFSVKALESQRSSGYKNSTFAIAELVDNSFDAGASFCRIIFIEKRDGNSRKYIDEILIVDDGEGMSDEVLKNCLQFGGTSNESEENLVRNKKIGKFGFGLPNASLSQCPNITVVSWRDQSQKKSTALVLETLKKSDSIEIPELEIFNTPDYFDSVGAILNQDHGTVVSWKECDRLSNSRAETIINKSKLLLGKLFRHLLVDGRKIEFAAYEYSATNNSYSIVRELKVAPNDPLFLMKNAAISEHLYQAANDPGGTDPERDPAEYYKKYSLDENRSEPTNTLLEDQSYIFKFEWRGHVYEFKITTSCANPDIQKPGIREGGHTKVGKFYKLKEKECISFVRSDREISSGNYGFYNVTDARQRWWSIEVAFTPDSDDLLGVHNNKQGIEFVYTDEVDPTETFDKHTATLQQAREQLWYQLTQMLETARKAAWKEILDSHKKWLLHHPVNPDPENPVTVPGSTTTTTRIQNDTDGKRARQFSAEDRLNLIARLKEKYDHLEHDKIEKAVDFYDTSKSRGAVLYSSSESDQLWSLTNVGSFLIVLINTNHMFYQNVIEPLKSIGRESDITAIELFISSLAWEEHTHFANGSEKQVIEDFRSYVGLHLNKYLREFTYYDGDASDEEEKS